MAPCGFFPPFLVRTRNGAARRGGTRQLHRSMSGKSKPAAGARYATNHNEKGAGIFPAPLFNLIGVCFEMSQPVLKKLHNKRIE